MQTAIANSGAVQLEGQFAVLKTGLDHNINRQQPARRGRAGPRSRNGCMTCKRRRVRCDEVHPVCSHCIRLQVECCYKPRQGRQALSTPARTQPQQSSALLHLSVDGNTVSRGLSTRRPRETRHDTQTPVSYEWSLPPTANGLDGQLGLEESTIFPFPLLTRGAFDAATPDLDTILAGDYPCLFPDDSMPESSSPRGPSHTVADGIQNANLSNLSEMPSASRSSNDQIGKEGRIYATKVWSSSTFIRESPHPDSTGRHGVSEQQNQQVQTTTSARAKIRQRRDSLDERSVSLIRSFRRVVQPPAAILIGGYQRWKRLQDYLIDLNEQSRAVRNALMCVVELLMIDETSRKPGESQEACMRRVFEWYEKARDEIALKLSKHGELRRQSFDHLLAAIFLLSWLEVIRDQDTDRDIFPRDLAEVIITSDTAWNEYSQQLLSWLNTLDSKASHLGVQQLLSPRALQVVSRFPEQIASSVEWQPTDDKDHEGAKDVDDPFSDPSPSSSAYSPLDRRSITHGDHGNQPTLEAGQIKQIVLKTVLQPALEWYLTSQSYCRRIRQHDKHHRSRSTADDEYEVITSCKKLEQSLLELWSNRPSAISLTTDQLVQAVSTDLAARLHEIFSIYLASFWILFVYLHRVSWWHLPHSPLARTAMDKVWQSLQEAYAELINGGQKRVVHPALLRPVFLFGSETSNELQQQWAVEQLEALGDEKPVLDSEEVGRHSLPSFHMSAGAVRNANRAAVLLRELIKQQNQSRVRVDDRDLSMKMFGCCFSIV